MAKAKAKKKFLVSKKEMGKSIKGAFVRTGVTSVGYLGAKGGTNLLINKIPEKFQKLVGPVKFLVGTMVDGFTEQTHPAGPFVKPLGVGIAVSGAEDMVMTFVPEDTRKRAGLSGVSIAANPGDEFDLNAELDKMAAEAEYQAKEQAPADEHNYHDGMNGVQQDDEVKDPSDLL